MARMTIATLSALVTDLTAKTDARFASVSEAVNKKVVGRINALTGKVGTLESTITELKKENATLKTEMARMTKFKLAVARMMRARDEQNSLSGEDLEQFLTERNIPTDDTVAQGLVVVTDRDERNWRVWVRYPVFKDNGTQAKALLNHIRSLAAWTTRNDTLWDDFGNSYVLISKALKAAAPVQPEPEPEQQDVEEENLEDVDF